MLRILIESGDVIKYVFPLMAGFESFIRDVRGGGRSIVSLWEFIGFGISRARIGLDQ